MDLEKLKKIRKELSQRNRTSEEKRSWINKAPEKIE